MTGEVIWSASDSKTGSSSSNVADTSKKAYRDLKQSGEIGDQASEVFQAIKAVNHYPSINELATGILACWEKSTISGRMKDLREADLIEMKEKRDDRFNGRKCKTWGLTSHAIQQDENGSDSTDAKEDEADDESVELPFLKDVDGKKVVVRGTLQEALEDCCDFDALRDSLEKRDLLEEYEDRILEAEKP